jgi:hypothetical protein
MTQFQSPPPAPGDVQPDAYDSPASAGPVRWSAAAVAAFVLSLLGCTGIGAVLGLILGIVGILATRGGRRRGMGLAVAALPISLIMGLACIFVVFLGIFSVRLVQFPQQELPPILGPEAGSPAQAADALLALAADEFLAEVDAQQAQTWVEGVSAKHGKLVSILPSQTDPGGTTPDAKPFLSFDAKFVNGPANVKLTFDPDTVWTDPKLVDIEVDGTSPRE